jgi:hypothetical protein
VSISKETDSSSLSTTSKPAKSKPNDDADSLLKIKEEREAASPNNQAPTKEITDSKETKHGSLFQQQQSSDSGIASSEDKDSHLNSSSNSAKSLHQEALEAKHPKRKLRGSSSGNEPDESQLITPISSGSSSTSCSSSTSSSSSSQLKSPSQKRPRKSQTKPNEMLTPPPSVLQDQLDISSTHPASVDVFGNHLSSSASFSSNVLAYKSAITEPSSAAEFKLPTSVSKSSTLKSLMDCPRTQLLDPKKFDKLSSFKTTNNSSTDETEHNADNEPRTLEDLLYKQWNLGAELMNDRIG